VENFDRIFSDSLSIQQRLVQENPEKLRPWLEAGVPKSRGLLLYGPRGVGKTTYLLRQAQRTGGFYASLDHPSLAGVSVYSLVEYGIARGYESFYLDEVQYSPTWSQELKGLYDSFPPVNLIASGSSSLLLAQGVGDLSRRFLGVAVPFLSFREFLSLRGLGDFPVLDPWKPDPSQIKIMLTSLPVFRHFEEYLTYGLRPLFLEGVEQYPTKILQTLQKTLTFDIPFLVDSLGANHLRLMQAVVGLLSRSSIPRIQVNSLCREWGVGKEKLYNLLYAMEQTGVLRILRKKHDFAAQSIGAKMFLADPSSYKALGGRVGNLREAYVACAFSSLGYEVWAATKDEDADFVVDSGLGPGEQFSRTVEVGGLGKSPKKADFVVRDGQDYPQPGVIPLWVLGMAW